MFALLKYEYRKTLVSKLLMLAGSVLAECIFLIGAIFNIDVLVSTGVGLLVFVAVCSFIYVLCEVMYSFELELKNKQSFMMFLTPKSSFEIMGAKTIQNLSTLVVLALFFGTLAIVDINCFTSHSVAEIFSIFAKTFEMIFPFTKPLGGIVFVILCLFFGWLCLLQLGFASIVIAKTLSNGKILASIIEFVVVLAGFLLFYEVFSFVNSFANITALIIFILIFFVLISALLFYLTCTLLERKMDF